MLSAIEGLKIVEPTMQPYVLPTTVGILGGGIPRWMARLFGALLRNSTHVTDSMRIPPEQLVDLGREVAI